MAGLDDLPGDSGAPARRAPLTLTYEEAAAMAGSGIGINTIRAAVSRGELVSVQIGSKFRRIPVVAMERWIRNLERRALGMPLEQPGEEVLAARQQLAPLHVVRGG